MDAVRTTAVCCFGEAATDLSAMLLVVWGSSASVVRDKLKRVKVGSRLFSVLFSTFEKLTEGPAVIESLDSLAIQTTDSNWGFTPIMFSERMAAFDFDSRYVDWATSKTC